VPFTYLSHQAPVLAVKRRWPAAFDGTAMVLGSMAPDWAYAADGTRLAFDGHSIGGVVLFCIPAAVLAGMILRRAAPVLFAFLPSPAAMPVRQLRALGRRRPPWTMTVVSAGFGALTHVVWDLFTHDGDWGPRNIAWLRSRALIALGHHLSWADVLQLASHVVGAVVATYLLSRILRSGSFRRWYGLAPDAGGREDDAPPPAGVARFWAITAVGLFGGLAWAAAGDPGLPGRIIRVSLGLAIGLVAASAACADEVRVPSEVGEVGEVVEVVEVEVPDA
jgi:hypothetical protein